MKDKSCFVCKWGVTILFSSKVYFGICRNRFCDLQQPWYDIFLIEAPVASCSGKSEEQSTSTTAGEVVISKVEKCNRGKWYCLPCVLWRTRLDEHNWSILVIDQYIELRLWHSKLCYSVLKCDIKTSNKSTGQTRLLVYFWGIVRQWT